MKVEDEKRVIIKITMSGLYTFIQMCKDYVDADHVENIV